jgi:hypothetical protein
MTGDENAGRIDDTIARLAARGADAFDAALAAAASSLPIETRVPATNAARPVELTRRTIERAIRGYVGWIASQVEAFDGAILAAVRELGDRLRAAEADVAVVRSAVARLERSVVTHDGCDDAIAAAPEDAMSEAWAARALEALGPVRGRVLHAEAGRGTLVAALRTRGVDVYGVEPRPAAYESGVEQGLEIHSGGALEHLRRVPAGVLSGIVLSGCVERLGVPDLVAISRLVGTGLEGRGRLVVASAAPEHWARTQSPVGADLLPGRPLHSATWVELLGAQPFDDIVVLDGPRPTLRPVPATTAGADVINDNFETLRARCDAPEWYIVAATRRERG